MDEKIGKKDEKDEKDKKITNLGSQKFRLSASKADSELKNEEQSKKKEQLKSVVLL